MSTGDHPAPTDPARMVASIAKGGGLLAAGDLFGYVTRAISAFVLARELGAHQYGLYNIAVSTAFVFSGIADFGLGSAMQRFIPVQRNRADHGGVLGTQQVGVRLTALGSLGFGLALLLLAPLMADRMFDEPALTVLFRLFVLIVPIIALSEIIGAIALGYKRSDHYAAAFGIIQPLVRLVLLLGFSFIALNPIIASILFAVSYASALVFLVGVVGRERREKTPKTAPRRDTKDVVVFAAPFWFTSILNKVRRNIQAILLGSMDSVTSAGVFALVGSANLIGRVGNLAISKSMRPSIAELFDSGDMQAMEHVYKTTTRWTLTLNLPIFVVMVVFPHQILNLFGESYRVGATALVILAASELANALTGTCGTIVDMSGKGRIKVINKVVMITLLIGGNLLLIPAFGLVGAATAVLVGNAVINLIRVVEVGWFAKIQPYEVRTLKPAVAGGLTMLAGFAISTRTPLDASFPLLLGLAIVIGILYLTVLTVLGLPMEERAFVHNLASRLRPGGSTTRR